MIIPLFLFGGAFYPIEQLPGWLQPIAKATPLWHGVELCRDAVLGTDSTSADTRSCTSACCCAFVARRLRACAGVTFARRLAE